MPEIDQSWRPMPAPGKEPLKVNVFEMARRGNTQLLPLFPYLGPGDIVPCCAVLRSDGSPHAIGYFVHTNSVDEVAVTLGGEGRGRTGDLFVGSRVHGVGGDTTTPFFAVQVITQRQLEAGDQPEAITFQCEKCNAPVYHQEFGSAAFVVDCAPVLPTIAGSYGAAEAWNDSESARRCPACGNQNPPFPLHFWGWAQHARASQVTELARQSLEQAGAR